MFALTFDDFTAKFYNPLQRDTRDFDIKIPPSRRARSGSPTVLMILFDPVK